MELYKSSASTYIKYLNITGRFVKKMPTMQGPAPTTDVTWHTDTILTAGEQNYCT